MIQSMKRLWRDRRGNVLAITGAAIPLVVGSAGLATDTVQWVTWKRELQRAADSAAIAGVMGKAWGASTADAAVNADLAKNQTTGIALLSGYPQISYPTSSSYSGAVRVRLAIQKRLGFSSLFLSSAPTIITDATAAQVDDGDYCVVALENGVDPGLTIGGSSNAVLGCGAISNSISQSASVDTNGNAYNFQATTVAGAGGLPTSIRGTSDLDPYHLPLQDPFAGQYDTTIPGSTPCRSFNQQSYTTTTGTGQNRVTTNRLQPGCYNDFSITGNNTYYMDPGVYYLNNTDFDIAGTAGIVGNGVTIILTGSNPGAFETNGNSLIQLTAPTTGPYAKMLVIQSSNADVDNLNKINGNNSSKYDGAVYLPRGKVTFTGSSGAMTKCAMVVAKKVDFSGNANLQNDVTGCNANQTVKAKRVRLVA